MYGLAIPPSARLSVQKIEQTLPALAFVDLVSVPAGKQGLVLATQLTVTSDTPNVLEGCYYLFPDAYATWENQQWSLLATGFVELAELH